MDVRTRRLLAIGALVAIGLLGFGTAAWARVGNGAVDVQNPYVRFSGSIYWYPNGVQHGGMNVYGNLYNSAGGNYAKIEGKVSGYGYTELWRTDGSTGAFYGNYIVYDPQAAQVNNGSINACHYDRWWADDCTSEYITRN